MTSTKKVLIALLAVLAMFAAACGSDEAEVTASSTDDSSTDDGDAMDDAADVKAAFIMVAPVGDAGWNFMHNEGRLGAEAATGVETAYVESIPENSAEFDNAVQQYIDDGFDVIFGTSFDYQFSMINFAENNPDVIFEHVSGFLMNDTNMGNTFGRMYQPRYIAGMAAGAETSSNKIGYVAAFPIPEVIRGINAFALGAKAVNPDATVEVAWTSTWFDPGVEGNAAQALIDSGADVLSMHQDSTATGQAISEAGGTFIGYHSDMSALVPNYLTAPVWDFAPRYTDVIEAVKAGSYTPEAWWGGMADGIVDIAIPDSSSVAGDMKGIKDEIINGEFDVFDRGTITDQDGNVIIEDGIIASEILTAFPDDDGNYDVVASPGDTLNDGVLANMNFFVDNVVGSLG
ncbi:MAG: BMP family ABC transporter substrate-binding protein [Acidimicrobiia bacterium]|nr:BMP family ABC transporter substrate-binding protein [Acidimicrobiia bacterium]